MTKEARQLSWLEHYTDKVEVTSSNLVLATVILKKDGLFHNLNIF